MSSLVSLQGPPPPLCAPQGPSVGAEGPPIPGSSGGPASVTPRRPQAATASGTARTSPASASTAPGSALTTPTPSAAGVAAPVDDLEVVAAACPDEPVVGTAPVAAVAGPAPPLPGAWALAPCSAAWPAALRGPEDFTQDDPGFFTGAACDAAASDPGPAPAPDPDPNPGANADADADAGVEAVTVPEAAADIDVEVDSGCAMAAATAAAAVEEDVSSTSVITAYKQHTKMRSERLNTRAHVWNSQHSHLLTSSLRQGHLPV